MVSAPSPRGEPSPPAAVATAAPAAVGASPGQEPASAPAAAPPAATSADWQRALDAVVPCVVVLK